MRHWSVHSRDSCIYLSIQSKDVCSEAIEEKSAVDFPFPAIIKVIKVFTNNWYNLESWHFYRQFKRGIPVSRSIEKRRRCETRPNFEASIFNRKNSEKTWTLFIGPKICRIIQNTIMIISYSTHTENLIFLFSLKSVFANTLEMHNYVTLTNFNYHIESTYFQLIFLTKSSL